MNNSFNDFVGKSTEITNLVQQEYDLSERFTNNLNTINNNLLNNGTQVVEDTQNYQPQQDILTLNDNNNNSNDNFDSSDFGPETDVDNTEDFVPQAIGDEAAGGEKERTQMEDKETDEVLDRVEEENEAVAFDEIVGTDPFMSQIMDDDNKDKPEVNEQNVEKSEVDSKIEFVGGENEDFSSKFTEEDLQEPVKNPFIDVAESFQQQIIQPVSAVYDQFIQSLPGNDAPFEHQELEHVEESHLESEHLEIQESMQSHIKEEEDELICANEVNEEVAIQKQEQPVMTGKFRFIKYF